MADETVLHDGEVVGSTSAAVVPNDTITWHLVLLPVQGHFSSILNATNACLSLAISVLLPAYQSTH